MSAGLQAARPGLRAALLLAALGAVVQWSGAAKIAAPFSATCVLLSLMPEAPFSRPRALLLSHLICVGSGALFWVVPAPAYAAAFASAWLSIVLMGAARAVHAPAAAHAVILALGGRAMGRDALWVLAAATGFAFYARLSAGGNVWYNPVTPGPLAS
jgi:CBS-domain-containing membrane protein